MSQTELGHLELAMQGLKRDLVVLLEHAPSDSVAEIYVHSSHDKFRTLIEVYSEQGRFVAACEADSIDRSFQDSLSDLERQIKDWRARRFTQAWLS